MQTVSIQGVKHSFHHQAAEQHFGAGTSDYLERESFRQIFDDVLSKEADFGVCAVENSLYGSINEIYDLLLRHGLWVCGEVYLRVGFSLLGLTGSKLEGIKEVYSHPIALAECHVWLDEHLPDVERYENPDTAQSAQDVADWKDGSKAAIAAPSAGKANGLVELASNIENDPHNYTRFLVLRRDRSPLDFANKTSLIIRTNHQPGALHAALGAFAKRDINLSKLQSRPIAGPTWRYRFHVDVEAGLDDNNLQSALDELKELGSEVITLGTYEKSSLPPLTHE